MRYDPRDDDATLELGRALQPLLESPAWEAVEAIVAGKLRQLQEDSFLETDDLNKPRSYYRAWALALRDLLVTVPGLVERAKEIVRDRQKTP